LDGIEEGIGLASRLATTPHYKNLALVLAARLQQMNSLDLFFSCLNKD
jgi:hypothetical protein